MRASCSSSPWLCFLIITLTIISSTAVTSEPDKSLSGDGGTVSGDLNRHLHRSYPLILIISSSSSSSSSSASFSHPLIFIIILLIFCLILSSRSSSFPSSSFPSSSSHPQPHLHPHPLTLLLVPFTGVRYCRCCVIYYCVYCDFLSLLFTTTFDNDKLPHDCLQKYDHISRTQGHRRAGETQCPMQAEGATIRGKERLPPGRRGTPSNGDGGISQARQKLSSREITLRR